MQELNVLREGWEEIQAIETRLLRILTIQESLQRLLELQIAIEKQLIETESLFAGERRAALADLQAWLMCLAVWQAAHGKTVSVHPVNTNPPG